MTKQEIVKRIARETGVEAATVSAVVEGFMEEVRAAQIRKENVFLRGFGTFLIKHRKEKTARNITKNTTLKIPAHDISALKSTMTVLSSKFTVFTKGGNRLIYAISDEYFTNQKREQFVEKVGIPL